MKEQSKAVKAAAESANGRNKNDVLTSKTLVEYAIDKAKNSKRGTWEESANTKRTIYSK